jgi:hypothetical protein
VILAMATMLARRTELNKGRFSEARFSSSLPFE